MWSVAILAPQRDWLLNGWAKTGGGGTARSHSLGQGPCTRRVLPPAYGSTWWTVAKEGVMNLHDAVVPPSGPCGRACRCFLGAVGMGPPTTPWSHIGLGSMVVLGRQPRPCIWCSTRLWRTREWCPGATSAEWGGTSIRGTASGGRDGNILANGQKSGRGGSFSRARPSDPPSLHC